MTNQQTIEQIILLKQATAKIKQLEQELAGQKEMTQSQFNTAEKLRQEIVRLGEALTWSENRRLIEQKAKLVAQSQAKS